VFLPNFRESGSLVDLTAWSWNSSRQICGK